MAGNRCKACNVEVSSDLANCPLCGKYVLNGNDKAKPNKFSYPVYNYSNIYKEKTLKIVRNIVIVACLICLFVNLIFGTRPYWFPYAVVSLFCIFMMFVHPFRKGGNLLKSMPASSFYLGFLIIFIDAYNHLAMGLPFGWGFSIVVPFVMVAVSTICAIISFTKNKYAISLAKRLMYIAIASVIYFLVKVLVFKNLITWPSLVFVCVSVGWWLIILIFKPKSMAKEMKKDFHI